MLLHSLIILTMIIKNEHKMTYMYNIQKQHTITEHIHKAICMYIHVICYMPTCMDPDNLSRVVGSRPNIFQGVPTLSLGGGGGVKLLFSIETCDFPEWVVRTLPMDLRITYIHVSLCKAFKGHKNVAGSKFQKV